MADLCEIPDPKNYNVSEEFGFLMENPLERLPQYFEDWNYLALNLGTLLERKQLRLHVEKLILLDHNRLESYKELRCAHLFLSLISHGYIWQDGDQGAKKILPKQLAIPWCGVSDRIGISPIITHCSFILANWRKGDKLGNIEAISVVNTDGSSNCFTVTTWQIEKDFAPAIQSIIRCMMYIKIQNDTGIIGELRAISNVIQRMKSTLSRMHGHLTADEFYNKIRPILTGWGGSNSPLPDGIIYEGVYTDSKKFAGGNGAQSSIFQCLDAALGIQHKPEQAAVLKTMRRGMPPEHVAFIQAVKDGPSIQHYVSERRNENLTLAYNSVLESLKDYRSYHIQIVTKYIVAVSTKEKSHKSLEKTGTGGTPFMAFLKSVRDTTIESRIQ